MSLWLFCSIVFDAYKKLSGSDIEDSITGETTGNLEDLLLAVGKTSDLSGCHLADHKVEKRRYGVKFFLCAC